ncbi:Transcription factor MYB88 [Linum perenne]
MSSSTLEIHLIHALNFARVTAAAGGGSGGLPPFAYDKGVLAIWHGERVHDFRLGQYDDGSMDGCPQPKYVCMPKKSASLTCHGEVVDVGLTGLKWALHDEDDILHQQISLHGTEKSVLQQAQRMFGNRWIEISKVVSSRTDNAVKNQLTTTTRKMVRCRGSIVGVYELLQWFPEMGSL